MLRGFTSASAYKDHSWQGSEYHTGFWREPCFANFKASALLIFYTMSHAHETFYFIYFSEQSSKLLLLQMIVTTNNGHL